MEKVVKYNIIDPTKRKELPRWKYELEAKAFHEDNVLKYPELVHVPFSITPGAVIDVETYVPD